MADLEVTMICPACGRRRGDHADRSLRVLLRMRGLSDSAETESGRLLRVLFVRGQAVSLCAG
jgi:hypothetical protein